MTMSEISVGVIAWLVSIVLGLLKFHSYINSRKFKKVTLFFKMERGHDTPVASLECAHASKSIISVTMHERKVPVNVICCSKTPKAQVEGFTHLIITSNILVANDRNGTFALAKTLLIQALWLKFPFMTSL